MNEPSETNDASLLFDAALEIDEENLSHMADDRGDSINLSSELRLIARENRLQLRKISARYADTPNESSLAETDLLFQSAAHPKCRFTWVVMNLDLSLSPGAKVTEIFPTSGGNQTIKFSEKLSPSIEAKIPGGEVKVGIGGESQREFSVSYPQVTGANFGDAITWTFSAATNRDKLHLNHPLKFLSEYPRKAIGGLRGSIRIQANIAFSDWKQVIPLVGKRTASVSELFYFDRMG